MPYGKVDKKGDSAGGVTTYNAVYWGGCRVAALIGRQAVDQDLAFGHLLRRLRKARDLTQDALAQQASCALDTIKKIEAGVRRPSHQLAAVLADLLALEGSERAAFLQDAGSELRPDRLTMPPPPRDQAAPILPTGTVTFLFTDIEGSTRLWEQHPQAMEGALARHDQILRQAIAAHAGVVYKVIGDAFQAAFPTAPAACAAALAAQRALVSEAWGVVGAVPVRMALHTCAAVPTDGDYRTGALNRLGRLLGAVHGGQIVLSRATADLARDTLPPDVTLRDLGERYLRDLRPEPVFQLVAPDLPSDFPPLRTLDIRRHNLPAQPTPLLGRDHEVATIGAQLRRADVRLVTLTGPGGIGKTRLAFQAATQLLDTTALPPPLPSQWEQGLGGEGHFPDGVWFVNLALVRDPGQVVPAIAQIVGVKELGDQSLIESLMYYLRDKQLLLVLDNFEHVLPAAPLVAELLAAAARLKVLVTSRVSLHLRGEKDFAVAPLAFPDPTRPLPVEILSRYPAIELLVQRMQDVQTDFALTEDNAAVIAELTARLDGLPLALELAAARIKLFPPEALLARMGKRLQVLISGSRDLPARQQTLRATIGWSYDLLAPAEQILFQRLGVFLGGWTIDAADAVCDTAGDLGAAVLDGLASLVDSSLVQRTAGADGEPRFTMLETIREYALERLEESGAAAIRERHAQIFLGLAEAAEMQLRGPQQLAWLNRMEADHDNLRAALAWSQAPLGDVELGVRLASALWEFWLIRGYFGEWRRWLVDVLVPNHTASTAVRARALTRAAILAAYKGDLLQAWEMSRQGLRLALRIEDQETAALATALLGGYTSEQVRLPSGVGYWSFMERDLANGEESLRLARSASDGWLVSFALNQVSLPEARFGDRRQAQAWCEESLLLARATGDGWLIASALYNAGELALREGDYVRARTYHEEGLAIRYKHGDQLGSAWALSGFVNVVACQGDLEAASAFQEARLTIERQLGNKAGIAQTAAALALLVLARGNYTLTEALLRESLVVAREAEGKSLGIALYCLGELSLAQADYATARTYYGESLAHWRTIGEKSACANVLAGLAQVAQAQGDYVTAHMCFDESMLLYREVGDSVKIADLLIGRGQLALAQADYAAARACYSESLALWGATEDKRYRGWWPFTRHGAADTPGIALCLAGLTAVALAQAQPERAAHLCGAAEAVMAGGGRLSRLDRADYERTLAAARAQLDAATFDAAWAAGAMLTLEQAIAYAVGAGD
jgi:predicted ATPase/class 3 adenylate cyclase/tetratricopeptide (TPR) repeat protein